MVGQMPYLNASGETPFLREMNPLLIPIPSPIRMKSPCPRPALAQGSTIPATSSLNVSYRRKEEDSLEDWGGELGSHLKEQTLGAQDETLSRC